MNPSRALTLAVLLASAVQADPPRQTFEQLFSVQYGKARAAFLLPGPILAAVSTRDLEALHDERLFSVTAPGARRDRVVEFISVLEKVAQLQGRAGQPPLSVAQKTALSREVGDYFRLSEDERSAAGRAYRILTGGIPGPFADAAAYQAGVVDLDRARGASGLIAGASGWTTGDAGALPAGAAAGTVTGSGTGPRPDPNLQSAQYRADFRRTSAPPPPPNALLILAGMRERVEGKSREANARLDDEFRAAYESGQLGLTMQDAATHWRDMRDRGWQPGDSVIGATARTTVATLALWATEPLRLVERNVQRLAHTRPDEQYSRRTGEKRSLRPDGYGITVVLSNGVTRRSFRSPAQGKAYLLALPPRGAKRVIFYGHGAPGLQTVGDDFFLDAPELKSLLEGKLQPGGRVDLIGCNTASIGDRSLEGVNVLGMAGYGLASAIRAGMYAGLPSLSGDDATAAQWNRDLARETSLALPGVYVTGMRTFAFPLDRLIDLFVPGGNDPTPSDVIIARMAVYLDGRETRL
jgi:hypothetical protein